MSFICRSGEFTGIRLQFWLHCTRAFGLRWSYTNNKWTYILIDFIETKHVSASDRPGKMRAQQLHESWVCWGVYWKLLWFIFAAIVDVYCRCDDILILLDYIILHCTSSIKYRNLPWDIRRQANFKPSLKNKSLDSSQPSIWLIHQFSSIFPGTYFSSFANSVL